jgi:hypothetical protein
MLWVNYPEDWEWSEFDDRNLLVAAQNAIEIAT